MVMAIHPDTARRTRIVVTIGPASADTDVLKALLAAGMDAARVNFSHGDPATSAEVMRRLRELSHSHGRPLAIIADLPGPKLRIGELAAHMHIIDGDTFSVGTSADLPVTDPELLRHLHPGDRMLIDDGAVSLVVVSVDGERVSVRALNGGVVSSHNGINLPDTSLPIPALTRRDRELLRLALEAGADHIAESFVRSAEDVLDLRAALGDEWRSVRIIAKIEKREALDALEGIIAASDGVMVARGDLGVEIPPAEVPLWQKAIIAAARRAGRPVITATQMLQSMVASPRPTRAEASDVANAILDSTDAVMLSAETAIGAYPVVAVQTMAEIVVQTERGLPGRLAAPCSAPAGPLDPFSGTVSNRDEAVTRAISTGACDVAQGVGATAIVTSTVTGRTTRAIARLRPCQKLIALSADPLVLNQLALCWGVTSLPCRGTGTFDDVVREADQILIDRGLCEVGDLVVITAGAQGYAPGTTNLIKAHTVR